MRLPLTKSRLPLTESCDEKKKTTLNRKTWNVVQSTANLDLSNLYSYLLFHDERMNMELSIIKLRESLIRKTWLRKISALSCLYFDVNY